MKHGRHLIYVVAALALAMTFLTIGQRNVAFAGLGLALLICPLAMGVVMWLLMRQPRVESPAADDEPRQDPVVVGKR